MRLTRVSSQGSHGTAKTWVACRVGASRAMCRSSCSAQRVPVRPIRVTVPRERALRPRPLPETPATRAHRPAAPSLAVSSPEPSTIRGSEGSTACASACADDFPVPPLPHADEPARVRSRGSLARGFDARPRGRPTPDTASPARRAAPARAAATAATSMRASDGLPRAAPAVDQDDGIRRGDADDRLEDRVRRPSSRARSTGSSYFLRARMTRLSARPATQTNGIATARKETMFGSKRKIVAPADVGAERNRVPAAAATAVAGLVGSATEAGPGERDRDDADAVDVLLLAVGAVHAEGRGLLTEFECDVGHDPTLPGREPPCPGRCRVHSSIRRGRPRVRRQRRPPRVARREASRG